MSLRAMVHSLAVCKSILWTAAWLVPGRGRAEWLAEWNAELWHVWQQGNRLAPLFRGNQTTEFCLGAFKDAFWLRREGAVSASRPFLRPGTASRSMLGLALMASVTVLIAYCRPGVWSVVRPYHYRAANDLVMISRGGFASTPAPTISLSEFETWKNKSRHLFTGLAFYQLSSQAIAVDHGVATQLQLARASENLFELLDVPARSRISVADRSRTNRVFLRQSFWADAFGSDPVVFGRLVRMGGQEAVIAGVIADEHWRLPGHVDAWLLEDAQTLDRLPPDSEGYVLGHANFRADADGRRQIYVAQRDEGYDWFVCQSLAERTATPLSTFLFALFLAALALPAITSFSLGEYPVENKDVPWATRIRRWAFLAVKFGLLIAVVYFGALDLAYSFGEAPAGASELIELFASFWGLLFGFGWALRDQRKRCPVCLRLLTNPARVGQFSRNFLAWHGTELVCLSGHGLLHVPDMATSWFDSQRWLYLDSSWSALFPLGT